MTFHVEHGVTASVGIVTGVGSYLIQSATLSSFSAVVTLATSLVSVIVAASVTWGVLRAEHRRTKSDVERLSGLMLETVQRLARIEAKLEQ